MAILSDKVAVVTGAAMGNGEGIARVLAQKGAKVILTDVSDTVFATADDIKAKGFDAVGYKMDVTKMTEIENVVNSVVEKFGRIDILVNNAGVIRLANFLEMSDEVRDFHFGVNVFGLWNCTKAILPVMVKQKYGKIVNMSSVTGPMVADEGETAYASTKAAIWGFTKALARETAKHNITVNAICPGYILTPMAEQIARESNPGDADSVIEQIAGGVPVGRLGHIEEIGYLVAFLASDEANYLTGTQVVIDGGSTLPETVSVGVG
ncbi:MAG: oxidoreductase UcpA [Firmicutes bacterium HGW-Firmicutes-14]|nr:MAG: oxidoreductase UcpA [Firmicutes bacterium HGW-Firmicutes-14]